jgi:hypothetical protein
MSHMKTITSRELHRETGRWIRRASEREVYLTERGRACSPRLGQLLPYQPSPFSPILGLPERFLPNANTFAAVAIPPERSAKSVTTRCCDLPATTHFGIEGRNVIRQTLSLGRVGVGRMLRFSSLGGALPSSRYQCPKARALLFLLHLNSRGVLILDNDQEIEATRNLFKLLTWQGLRNRLEKRDWHFPQGKVRFLPRPWKNEK